MCRQSFPSILLYSSAAKKCVHVDMPKSLNQRRLCLEKDGTRYQLSLAVVLGNEFHDISIFLNDLNKRHQSFKCKLQKVALFVEFFNTINQNNDFELF